MMSSLKTSLVSGGGAGKSTSGDGTGTAGSGGAGASTGGTACGGGTVRRDLQPEAATITSDRRIRKVARLCMYTLGTTEIAGRHRPETKSRKAGCISGSAGG